MQDQTVSKKLDENILWWKQQFSDCADIKMRPMCLGKNMNGCAEKLFYQLVQKLSEIGEIEFESMFVDGTKIEANANKYR